MSSNSSVCALLARLFIVFFHFNAGGSKGAQLASDTFTSLQLELQKYEPVDIEDLLLPENHDLVRQHLSALERKACLLSRNTASQHLNHVCLAFWRGKILLNRVCCSLPKLALLHNAQKQAMTARIASLKEPLLSQSARFSS